MAHDRCSKCGGSAYKVCSGCYDAMVLQVEVARKALERVLQECPCGPKWSKVSYCSRCIEVNRALGGLAEKPKSECRSDCRCCADVKPGDVHGCSCHTEKRVEPSHNEAMESQDDE